MSEPEGPSWEAAEGFVARAAPLWQRQVAEQLAEEIAQAAE